eukprot:TRINITY_DN27768_c0_g1_i1.p1 TRINITY_DN27768_c0_g1~~TRINITY_DN27768_c0_g1_i1.p1  ORF type:complete len:281 (-),score=42.57 TRINITY_DN27768_c0_g1_i1:99-941(-)
MDTDSRLSASCVILKRETGGDRDFSVLMQRRGRTISRAGFFVFPGGVHEPSDTDLKATAARELFEESGILLSDTPPASSLKPWRKTVHDNPAQFDVMLAQLGANVRRGSLHHYVTFITPSFETRKYTTLFFLAEITEREACAGLADGHETEELQWMDPSEALAKLARGEIQMLPPQFYVLSELCQHKKLDAVLEQVSAARLSEQVSVETCVDRLDARGYPAMQPLPVQTDDEQGITLALPKDEEHHQFPGVKGARHRIVCRLPVGQGNYVLQRNLNPSRL